MSQVTTAHEQAIAVYRQLLDSWNRRNAEEFASLFTEDGSSVGFDGSPLNGRTDIASTLREIYGHHQTAAYVAEVREIRDLAPGVVLLRAVVGMVPPGKQELNPAVNAIQSVLLVARDSALKIALLHNTPAAFHGRPQLVEQLTQELTAVLAAGRVVDAGPA